MCAALGNFDQYLSKAGLYAAMFFGLVPASKDNLPKPCQTKF